MADIDHAACSDQTRASSPLFSSFSEFKRHPNSRSYAVVFINKSTFDCHVETRALGKDMRKPSSDSCNCGSRRSADRNAKGCHFTLCFGKVNTCPYEAIRGFAEVVPVGSFKSSCHDPAIRILNLNAHAVGEGSAIHFSERQARPPI